jgi:hypothetical protein
MPNELFRKDNTAGYSDAELDVLNAEWTAIIEAEGLEPHTEEYNQRAHWFCDSVAGR